MLGRESKRKKGRTMLEMFQVCSKLKKKNRKRLSRQKTNVDTLAKATSDTVKIGG